MFKDCFSNSKCYSCEKKATCDFYQRNKNKFKEGKSSFEMKVSNPEWGFNF